jgi:diadenosine tetraphosphate (Ap4A) HIT family hydrolase
MVKKTIIFFYMIYFATHTLYASCFVQVPQCPIENNSLQVGAELPLPKWTDKEHESSFEWLQKIVSFWKDRIADDYLVYGKHTKESSSFHWEIIPHYRASLFGDFGQQLSVLWNISFGSGSLPYEVMEEKAKVIDRLFEQTVCHSEDLPHRGEDPFCKEEVIEKQWVLKGNKSTVLFNYAPIGFGGERLHFLIISKEHKQKFEDLSSQEYLEISQFASRLIQKYSDKDAYLFHKTGRAAGQTVPHFHMHLVFTSNRVQDVFGKLTVFKKMLLGSSPMSDGELRTRVEELRIELR